MPPLRPIIATLMLLAAAAPGLTGDVEDRLRAADLMRKGRHDAALPIVQELVAHAPTAQHTAMLGECELRAGDPDRARQLLAAATASRPEQHEWLSLFAESLARTGRCDVAISVLDRAIAIADLPRHRYDRAMCRLDLGQPSAAEQDLRTALAAAPSSLPIAVHLGGLLAASGQDAEARLLLEQALMLEPDHVEANAILAQVLLRTDEPEASADHARRVLRQVPSHVAATYTLGRALLAMGQQEEGRTVLDRSRELVATEDRLANMREFLSMEPQNSDVRVELARLLLELGRTAEAIRELDAARIAAPNDPRPLQLLERAHRMAGAANGESTP